MKRIEFLDGYRGFALLLIAFYHAFYRWPDIVPYGHTYAEFPLFRYGYLGINLFLLLSGFVILMTLEKSKNFSSYIFNRWKRLFPAMLVASILIVATACLFPERPRGMPLLRDIVPGITFLEPQWLKTIFRLPFRSLEGTFWSIYVEVKFYVIFGLLFFCIGRTKAILGLLLLYLISVVVPMFHHDLLSKIIDTLSFKYFCWFAGGCYSYLYFKNKELKCLICCIMICGFDIVQSESSNTGRLVAAFIMLGIYILPIYFNVFRGIFSNKLFLFLGFVSYPFYLIHENAMIAMIIKLDRVFNGAIPDLFLPLIPLSLLIFLAYLIAKFAEPFLKQNINKLVKMPN
jgi:peptidoglycan/LPS O-acetylase OafA/YrhL